MQVSWRALMLVQRSCNMLVSLLSWHLRMISVILMPSPDFLQIALKYNLIFVITKLGLLFVYDLETATAVYRNRISPDPIFLTVEATTAGGFYAINRRGQVLLATVNEATIVPFVSMQVTICHVVRNVKFFKDYSLIVLPSKKFLSTLLGNDSKALKFFSQFQLWKWYRTNLELLITQGNCSWIIWSLPSVLRSEEIYQEPITWYSCLPNTC